MTHAQHLPRALPATTALERVLARLRGRSLDRLIAAGHGTGTRLLRQRSAWLVRSDSRTTLADNWNRLLSPHRLSLAPLNRRAIEFARPDIAALVARLRSDAPVAARGVALAALLLTDGTGPLYRRQAPQRLVTEIQAALRALDR